jgi:hypothetical protein
MGNDADLVTSGRFIDPIGAQRPCLSLWATMLTSSRRAVS